MIRALVRCKQHGGPSKRPGPGKVLACVLGVALLVTGCVSSSPSESPTTGARAEGQAVLDWDTATVTLPLDRYGMAPRETLIVSAAAGIKAYQCQTGSTTLDSAMVTDTIAYLNGAPQVSHWLWGRWDAPYVAKFGLEGEQTPPMGFGVIGMAQDDPCWRVIADAGLQMVTGFGVDPALSNLEASLVLASAGMNSYDQALTDPGYLSLQARWSACITQAGYAIDPLSSLGITKWDDTWSESQFLQAMVTEAQCADNMNYTQQVADIFASYQMKYIADHEAELVAIKQLADETVARATKVLTDAGVL